MRLEAVRPAVDVPAAAFVLLLAIAQGLFG
jgi:hypothetical protein